MNKIEMFEKWVNYVKALPFFEKRELNYIPKLISGLDIKYGVIQPDNLVIKSKKIAKPDWTKDGDSVKGMFAEFATQTNSLKAKANEAVTSLLLFHKPLIIKSRRHYMLDNYVTVLTPSFNTASFSFTNIKMEHHQYIHTDKGMILFSAVHPHISTENSPCYGGFSFDIKSAVDSLNLPILSIILRNWLTTYNSRDKYSRYDCLNRLSAKIDFSVKQVHFSDIYLKTRITDDMFILSALSRRLLVHLTKSRYYSFNVINSIKDIKEHFWCTEEEAIYKLFLKAIQHCENRRNVKDSISKYIELGDRLTKTYFTSSRDAIISNIIFLSKLDFTKKLKDIFNENIQDLEGISLSIKLTKKEQDIVVEASKVLNNCNTNDNSILHQGDMDKIIKAIKNNTEVKHGNSIEKEKVESILRNFSLIILKGYSKQLEITNNKIKETIKCL